VRIALIKFPGLSLGAAILATSTAAANPLDPGIAALLEQVDRKEI
jgi:hypothetical protein